MKPFELPDEKNPEFLFQTTDGDLLVQIANHVVDPVFWARKELANRGLNRLGQWVGFKQAEKEHKV